MKTKKCSRCYKRKKIEKFSKDRHHSTGYKSACKECATKDFILWRNKNIERVKIKDRINYYINTYNLSLEEAKELVNDRSGVCKICEESCLLVIDHNHITNKIRGYICSSCNSTLGYARDSIDILEACIEYLKRNKENES